MVGSRQDHRELARALTYQHIVCAVDVQATEDGPRTEIVINEETVPPRILEMLANHNLGVESVQRKGVDYKIIEAV